jgi:hypothetical protein
VIQSSQMQAARNQTVSTSVVEDGIELFFRINGRYLLPLIVIVGCVSNVFVLIVLSLKQYRQHASCLYLQWLAVFDSVTLVIIGIIATENDMSSRLVATLGDPFCAIVGFVINLTPEMSSWTIVGIAFTRFIAVVYPLKAAMWSTFKAAKIYLVSMFIVLGIAALPDLFLSRAPPSDEIVLNFGCIMLMSEQMLELYHTIHMLLACAIPVIFLCVLNIPIIYQMNKRGKDTAAMRSTVSENKDEKIVITLAMVVTIAFFILVIPYVFHFVIWYFLSSVYMLNESQMKQRTLSYTITNDLFAVNCSVNFILYFVACKRFREDFRAVLLCRCNRLWA